MGGQMAGQKVIGKANWIKPGTQTHKVNWVRPTPAPTNAPKCRGHKTLAGPFQYFNKRAHSKNCEHSHHFLYEYKGADCVWISEKQEIATPASYGQLYTRFQMMEYGN